MRRATTQRVTPRITGKMANPTAFCKSENFDSIDQVETTSDTLTGRAGLTFQITWDRFIADAVLRGGSRAGPLFQVLKGSESAVRDLYATTRVTQV